MEIRNFSTDIAVIGGGGAALRAAIEASEKGQNVILVDKGRPGRSGATPCALWSVQAPFGPRGQDERDSPEQFFKDFEAERQVGQELLDSSCTELGNPDRTGHQRRSDPGFGG
jgi:succinate dehydrogenase/fumarate reductase flavoprotein subunit